MSRLSSSEFERRCQKPDHRRVGNWMARRVARPAALRVTRVVAPWGVSANMGTLVAWTCGVAGAAALACGTPRAWIAAVVLLQLWYLFDHVDGQLARLRGTASLDGAELDYLMHHTIHLLVPLGVGWGLFVRSGRPLWAAAGLSWGLALLLVTLQHDALAKAFIQRLKRVRGRLEVIGGGGGRPQPQPRPPRSPARLLAFTARKACEIHVIMNLLSLIAVIEWLSGDERLLLGRAYLALAAPLAAAVAAWTLVRSQRAGMAERAFAAWYRPPAGHDLVFRDGWWHVEPAETGQEAGFKQYKKNGREQSP